jgi:hypothetical protein
MHLFPETRVDNGLMLPGIGLAFVDGFTAIDAIVQQAIEVALIDQRALFAAEPIVAQFAGQNGGRAYLNKTLVL